MFSTPLSTSRCQASHKFGFGVLLQLESVLSFLSQCTPGAIMPGRKGMEETKEEKQRDLRKGLGVVEMRSDT